jgi:hypothetical protein
MKFKKYIGVFLGLLFLVTMPASGKGLEAGLERCISDIMKSAGYCSETESFAKLDKSSLIFFKKLKQKEIDLNGITTIYSKKMKVSKESKYPDFEIQIWSFEDEEQAEVACTLVKDLALESSFFEKPPKVISYYKNHCIFITTPVFLNRKLIEKALNILDSNIINCSE